MTGLAAGIVCVKDSAIAYRAPPSPCPLSPPARGLFLRRGGERFVQISGSVSPEKPTPTAIEALLSASSLVATRPQTIVARNDKQGGTSRAIIVLPSKTCDQSLWSFCFDPV
jgi:hypothetical protein